MRRDRNQNPEENEEDLEFEEDEPVEVEEDEPVEDFEEDEYEETDTGEYEEPDDDEYYDDDFYEEGEQEEFEFPDEAESEPRAKKEPRQPLRLKAKALWATVAAQARGVELPGKPDLNLDFGRLSELDRNLISRVVAIVLLALAVGVGAFLLAKGSGDDVEAARLEGEAAGKQAGAIKGAAEGYAAGFKKGRDRGFEKAYTPAYLLYFKRAFEQAGLDVPSSKDITVPEP